MAVSIKSGAEAKGIVRVLGLAAGPVVFAAVLLAPIADLELSARGVLGLTLWMGVWWLTQVIPIYVTALLPLLVYPFLGSPQLVQARVNYADSIVFLFLGGFLLGRGIESVGLDRRVALFVLSLVNVSPSKLVGAFMAVTALLSTMISNTATAVLMLPIALAVIANVPDPDHRQRFGMCLVLSTAYAANLGGLATLIGTPPNAILASLAAELAGFHISFANWLLAGVPISLLSVIVVWWYMVNIGVKIKDVNIVSEGDSVKRQLEERGPIGRDEKLVAIVLGVTVLAWLSRGVWWGELVPTVGDATIALAAGMLLFILPGRSGGMLMTWQSAARMPWGVLLLLGGGLTLAAGFTITGLDAWIAGRLEFLAGVPSAVTIVTVVSTTVMISEVMSNTATAALLLPIAASLASTIDLLPMQLMAPVSFATTFCFTLPIATPPNAIVFASGYLTVGRMARIGFPLDLAGIVIVTLFSLLLVPLVWS